MKLTFGTFLLLPGSPSVTAIVSLSFMPAVGFLTQNSGIIQVLQNLGPYCTLQTAFGNFKSSASVLILQA